MPWHYKSPSKFPAAYLAALRKAATQLDEPIMLGGFINLEEAKALAERFRYLRWCIRQNPLEARELFDLLSDYDYRTYIQQDDFGILLYLVARPTKLSEFTRLNPALAKELLPLIS